jgi:hypothetical protein
MGGRRNVEIDVMGIDAQEEKCHTDEDMWWGF